MNVYPDCLSPGLIIINDGCLTIISVATHRKINNALVYEFTVFDSRDMVIRSGKTDGLLPFTCDAAIT